MTEPFTTEEQARYSRQLMLPEISRAGQERLKAARVLCIGAGGLGSPAALYLAAAGVGTLGIVDSDAVELSNLHRQILHGTNDLGRPKIDSARERIHETNPHVEVIAHHVRLSASNAEEIIANYEVVIDGSDNFPTRYLTNDVCVFLHKPNVYGSVFRFDGQASVFAPHLNAPCYRCIFPEPPPPGAAPSCAEAGVLGILPGIIGLIQATEAIKLILVAGKPLLGRLLHFDALKMRFREFAIRRDPACPVCGENPTIREPIDYEQFCGVPRQDGVASLSVHQLKAKRDRGEAIALIDVREPFEYEIARIEHAHLIPLGELDARRDEIPLDREVVLFCHSGMRSARAAQILREHGITNTYNLVGGIDAWSREIDPSVARY